MDVSDVFFGGGKGLVEKEHTCKRYSSSKVVIEELLVNVGPISIFIFHLGLAGHSQRPKIQINCNW